MTKYKSINTSEPYIVGKFRWRLLIFISLTPFNLFMHRLFRVNVRSIFLSYTKLYSRILSVAMVRNCAPLVANLFVGLFCCCFIVVDFCCCCFYFCCVFFFSVFVLLLLFFVFVFGGCYKKIA